MGGLENKRIRQFVYAFAIFMSLLAGLYLRISDLDSRGLEYDEIWTLSNYANTPNVATIFTDVSTPNNHPLHSFAMRCSVYLLGSGALGMRFPAFLAGIGVIVLSCALSWRLFRSLPALAITAILCSLSGVLVHYSQTARGYSMQCFFLLLFALALILAEQVRNKWGRGFWRVVQVFSAFAAVLTLSTSVVFLGMLLLFHLFWLWQRCSPPGLSFCRVKIFLREHFLALFTHAIWLFCAAVWYLWNLQKFLGGMSRFGGNFESWTDLFPWFFDVLGSLGAWPFFWLFGLLLFLRRRFWSYGWAHLLLVLLPLFALPLTTAGPARVYSPLAAFFAVTTAAALVLIPSFLRKRRVRRVFDVFLVAAVLATCSFCFPGKLAFWTPIDWKKTAPAIMAVLPGNVYISYPSCDGLPIVFNRQEVVLDSCMRIPSSGEAFFLQVGNSKEISGIELKNMGDCRITVPVKAKELVLDGISCGLYRLVPLECEPNPASNAGIVLISLPPQEWMRGCSAEDRILDICKDTLLLLNPFLCRKIKLQDGRDAMAKVYVADMKGIKLQDLRDIEKDFAGSVFFYRFAEVLDQKQRP